MDSLALIFDVDGTLADTEGAHREAFNEAFIESGLGWHWSEVLYTRLLAVSGGKERLAAYFHEVSGGAMPRALLEEVHAAKTRHYTARLEANQMALRPGVLRLIEEASARKFPIAIATTTSPVNVDALLRGPLGARWRDTFAVVGDAACAERKKPDPEVYLFVLERLRRAASTCVAFEDSKNGLDAARAAGIAVIITPTPYTARESFAGARAVLPNLGRHSLDDIASLVLGAS